MNHEEFHEKQQKELNTLPINFFFFNDVVLFYKIVNSLVPIKLPREFVLIKASEVRFTRSTENIINTSDKTMFKCNIKPNCNSFENSLYLYRVVVIWNKLPFDI